MTVVEELLTRQKAAWREQGPLSYDQRKVLLRSLAKMLADHRDEFTAAISHDFGNRHPRESEIYEIYPLQAEIRYVLKHLKRWMRPQRVHTRWPFFPGQSVIVPQALGVVGIIGAWNFPLLLTLLPLISAIAAGNRVILKAPRLVPQSMAALAQRLGELAPPETLCLLEASPELDQIFPRLPFDHLIFSGSTRTGRVVARAAARNLVPATLSLSGKSPAILERDYLLDQAARALAAGKFINAGQTCIAPDYCLVHADQRDRFIAQMQSAITALYPGWDHNPDYTHVPNAMLRRRLQELLDDAVAKGATLWQPAGVSDKHHGFAPTLLWNTRPGMMILEEEIFGPILVIMAYATIQEAIDYVRDRPAPLALYYFDQDRSRAMRLVSSIPAGGVGINDTLFHVAQPGIPFGGIGHSGMGQYRGIYGFRRFSHFQGIYRQGWPSACPWIRPPYGANTQRLMRWLLRWG